LTAQLDSKTTPNRSQLLLLYHRVTSDHEGLELPAILEVRDALECYLVRSATVGDSRVEDEFRSRVETLAQLLSACDRSSDGATLAVKLELIPPLLAWFERHEQVPALVQAVRQLAGKPNVRLIVSQPLITQLTTESMDRVDPLTDCILGTSIRGTSHLVGTLDASPVTSRDGIRLLASLRGDAVTQGRASNGPVRAHVNGHANVSGQGEILFDPNGFRVGHTTAQVTVTGTPSAIWTVYRSRIANGLITHVARRRAARTKELSQQIASQHAQQRLQIQIEQELRARLTELQEQYQTRFRHPLLRRKAFPELFETRSWSNGAELLMCMASSCQLGALESPPPIENRSAVTVQFHQSAINNLATSFLSGKQVSEIEVRDLIDRIFGPDVTRSEGSRSEGSRPEDSRDRPKDGKVLHIVCADDRPISLYCENQEIALKVRAKNFILNRRKYSPMDILIRYRLEFSSKGWVATQVHEAEITPPRFETEGRGRLGSREIAARRLIRSMLERDLRPQYVLQEIELPEPFDSIGKMGVTQVVADNGWLTIGSDKVTHGNDSPRISNRGSDW
jgi:hypothetical protein